MGDNKIGSASDVVNVNQGNSDNVRNMLQQMMSQAGAQMGNLNAVGNMAALQGIAPGIQSLVGQLSGDYIQNANQARDLIMNDTMRAVGNLYSGPQGNINSGGAREAFGQGAASVAANTATQIAGMQSQMGMGLGNAFLGQRGQEYQTQAGLYGQAAGMQQQQDPNEWWQPSYSQGMGGMGGLMQGAGVGAVIGTDVPGVGTLAGAGVGGLAGLLGGLLGL
jgi:hypothetical protein